MSKFIYRTYDESSIKGLKQAKQEHNRLVDLGYQVRFSSAGFLMSHVTYEVAR
mgnify:FL=1